MASKLPLLGVGNRSVVKKFWSEIHGLTWTLAGTGMVLITLSGSTLKWGIWITLIGLAVHFAAAAGEGSETDE